ncbi:MAG: hypothetical protein ACREFY_15795 [Acetobacteraceae bacterium]
MRTNPFLDSLLFLIGYDGDYTQLGHWQYPLIVFFDILVAANLALLVVNWRGDPGQRTTRNVYLWITRSLLGAMWFQGSIWKLPLPVSGGFKYWMQQVAGNAAWPAMVDFYKDALIPHIAILNIVAYTAETAFAIALMLGFLARPAAVAGMAYAANIWLGLYHKGSEWPWEYAFLILVLGMIAADAVGRSFGLDALLRRNPPQLLAERTPLGRVYRAIS